MEKSIKIVDVSDQNETLQEFALLSRRWRQLNEVHVPNLNFM